VTRWTAAAIGLLLVAVAVPTGWWLTRPSPADGPPVLSALAAPGSPSSTASPATPSAVPASATPPGSASASGRTPAPVRLRIPRVAIDAQVLAAGVEPDGSMTVPRDARRVGWYRYGPAPGDRAGAAVISGHVDARSQGAGAMFRLREVRVGDRIEVGLADGSLLGYRVLAKQTIVKQRLPVDQLFARDGAPRLVLITCGGPFVPELSSYRDNVVVVSEPDPTSRGA